mgnify:CR=1 FL=1
MTKNDDKCVPALRFKGFNNDWAQHKLGDIAQRKNKTSDCSKLPNVSYEDISPNIGTLNKSVNKLSTGKKGILFKKDDVLFGKLRPYLNNYLFADFTGIAIGDFWVLNHKEAPQFLFYLIQSPKFRYISNISSGSKMPRSDWNLVSNYKFNVPAVFEQTNIGKTLKLIDTLITLQQRKLQQLKLLKKAMLQDLFTDKNVPKLRFNGFDANWIQCKLGKETLLTMGQSPSGSTYSDQPSTYILVQGNADLKNGWVKPRIWTTQITKLAKKGDIIITVRAPAGKVGRTNFDVVLGRGVASIHGNDFIFYLLSKMDMNKYWKKYAAGSTFESINSDDIKNTRVHVPNLSEQNRIANLFLRLDDLIRFQQNKLNNLQKTKQFLLQNMFI